MTQLREVIVNGLRVDLGQCQLDKMFMMIISEYDSPTWLKLNYSIEESQILPGWLLKKFLRKQILSFPPQSSVNDKRMLCDIGIGKNIQLVKYWISSN